MNLLDSEYKHVNKLIVACLIFSSIVLLCGFPVGHNLFKIYRGSSNNVESKDELGRALEAASMEDKTLIITIVNKAYAEKDGMLDLFLRSLQIGEGTQHLTGHLLVVAMDQAALDRCHQLKLFCYGLLTEGVDFSGEKIYMSSEFIRMMWKRTLFLTDVLLRGYNFIFTDSDVMWLRNPVPRLSHAEGDLQISCDNFNGRQWDSHNPINTGFYFIRSSNKTISLYERWYSARNDTPGLKEQDVLQKMVRSNVTGALDLKLRFLETSRFAGFCQHSKNIAHLVTIHANCCRTISAKMADLRVVLEDWKRFMDPGLNPPQLPLGWVEHNACKMSWKKTQTNNTAG